jgi:hypothetical protein
MTEKTLLFEEVCAQDFLKFSFGGRSYQDQLYDSISKTSCLAAVKVELIPIALPDSTIVKVVWVTHNFGFRTCASVVHPHVT